MRALTPIAIVTLFIANILYWYEVVFKFTYGRISGTTMPGIVLIYFVMQMVFISLGIAIALFSTIVLAMVHEFQKN